MQATLLFVLIVILLLLVFFGMVQLLLVLRGNWKFKSVQNQENTISGVMGSEGACFAKIIATC